MLSDVCHDALREVWDAGCPDLEELRRNILNYSVKPYSYPKNVMNILLAAVNEVALEEKGGEGALATPLTLMALLLCTLRGYDHPDVSFETGLEAELLSWWPRANEAVARLPPPKKKELDRLRRN